MMPLKTIGLLFFFSFLTHIEIAEHFQYGNQEDAHEFLRYTVDAMQKSCLPENMQVNPFFQSHTIFAYAKKDLQRRYKEKIEAVLD